MTAKLHASLSTESSLSPSSLGNLTSWNERLVQPSPIGEELTASKSHLIFKVSSTYN